MPLVLGWSHRGFDPNKEIPLRFKHSMGVFKRAAFPLGDQKYRALLLFSLETISQLQSP